MSHATLKYLATLVKLRVNPPEDFKGITSVGFDWRNQPDTDFLNRYRVFWAMTDNEYLLFLFAIVGKYVSRSV